MNSLLLPRRLEPIEKDKNEKARKAKNKQAKTKRSRLPLSIFCPLRMRKLRKMYFALFYILNESQRREVFLARDSDQKTALQALKMEFLSQIESPGPY